MSVRDGKTLSVSVFDPAVAAAVEKGIRGAGLNLNPISDGSSRIRVPIPRPTKETREAMRKVSHFCSSWRAINCCVVADGF